jgi:hypothetical protein
LIGDLSPPQLLVLVVVSPKRCAEKETPVACLIYRKKLSDWENKQVYFV